MPSATAMRAMASDCSISLEPSSMPGSIWQWRSVSMCPVCQFGSLVLWFFGSLVFWFFGFLVGWFFGWLVFWLAGWLVGWLAGWLVGWSAALRGWLRVWEPALPAMAEARKSNRLQGPLPHT